MPVMVCAGWRHHRKSMKVCVQEIGRETLVQISGPIVDYNPAESLARSK